LILTACQKVDNMDVRMPDGTLVKNVPENITQSDLLARYSAFKTPDTRGNIIQSDVPTVAGEVPNPPVSQETPRTMMDRVKALYEVPATIGSGMLAQPIGSAYGVYKGMTNPNYGTQQGVQEARVAGGELAQKLQYQPTSPVTQDVLQSVSGAMEAAKLPVTPSGIGQLPSFAQQARNASQFVRPMMQEAVQTAKPAISSMAQALRKDTPTMSGVGAAEVPEAVTRMQMAQQLRVPVDLSKGQAMRDLGQQKFEIETPKNFPEIGKPLIEAQAKRNDAILQNFDAFIDATGKETYGLRETGRVVDKALVNYAKDAKAKYKQAYEIAQNSEEGQQLVNVTGIVNQLDNMEAQALSAKVINSAKMALNKLAPKGEITLNNLEEVRKMVGDLSKKDLTEMKFGGDIKKMIDATTVNAGGDLFKEARKLRTNYAREFENVGYVDKLLRTKLGTSDRAVAFEDVFDHSILNGSLDDVRAIGKTLKKAGPDGQQAWKELKGQTIQYLKDKVSQSVDVDSFGNSVVSPAKFKSVVTQLDQDGKLDYVLGKAGAQEVRDLLETTINVNAPLKGAANYSNTSSAIITALDKIGNIRIPVVSNVAKYASEKGKESALKKQIEESVNYTPEGMADALRKTK
jgi:hypothetical protein